MDGEKKVGGAAAKIGVASKEGAGPLVPDDASGTNVLLMTENVCLKSNFCQ